MTDAVCAVQTPDYSPAAMDRAVSAHFSAMKAEELLRPGMKVVLKPNLLLRRKPEEATTTHPALVEAVCRRLRAIGIDDITIADSPGGPYTKPLLAGVYSGCGMNDVAEHTGALLNDDTGWESLSLPEASLCRDFNVITPVARADAVINLPRLKTHGMVTMSGAVKNLFGCVPGLQKPELHFRFRDRHDFCRMLVDLSRLISPCLTIVDAVVSMEGNGPSGGIPKETGLTFSARNLWALDLALCEYIGFHPDEVPTVRIAVQAGLCPPNAGQLSWLGEKPAPNPFRHPDSAGSHLFTGRLPAALRKPVDAFTTRFLSSRPVIYTDRCIGCGKCAESCAPGAATLRNGVAHIAYARCIKCYCCHELCPVRAVGIRRSPLSARS